MKVKLLLSLKQLPCNYIVPEKMVTCIVAYNFISLLGPGSAVEDQLSLQSYTTYLGISSIEILSEKIHIRLVCKKLSGKMDLPTSQPSVKAFSPRTCGQF